MLLKVPFQCCQDVLGRQLEVCELAQLRRLAGLQLLA